jgi:hypothetical protein
MGITDEDRLMFIEWLGEHHGLLIGPDQIQQSLLSVPEIMARWRPVSTPQRLQTSDLDITMFSGWWRGGGKGLHLVFVANFREWRGVVVV